MQMGCNATQTVSLFPWEQPVRWWVPGRFIFPSPVCGAGLVGTVRILSAGVQSLGWTAGSENTSDRCFQSLIQSATSHFLCNMQGSCCCLRARLLYSEREKFTWRIICQGIKQSYRWDDDLSCTWDVLTIIWSLHYKVMFLLPPVSWQAAWSSPAFAHLIFICSAAHITKLGVCIAGDKAEDSEIISKQLGQGCTNPSALRDPEGLFLFISCQANYLSFSCKEMKRRMEPTVLQMPLNLIHHPSNGPSPEAGRSGPLLSLVVWIMPPPLGLLFFPFSPLSSCFVLPSPYCVSGTASRLPCHLT